MGLHANINSLDRFRISRGDLAKKFSAPQSLVQKNLEIYAASQALFLS
jgi:hypothetical protein